MNKYPLIGVSICAVVLLVLGSLTNVVGYQTVQSSNQNIINDEVDQKELLFQTIVDIVNNKEIQKVILGSEIIGKRFFDTGVRFSVFNTPVLTKNNLKHMYLIGLMLTKTISKSKIHSLLERYQVKNEGVQKEISAVIEKDAKLKGEITQLSTLSCDCENENTTKWGFPILCELLVLLWFSLIAILYLGLFFPILFNIVESLMIRLDCIDIPYLYNS
jgi:hypothetical protein